MLEGYAELTNPLTVRVSKAGVYAEIIETQTGCLMTVHDSVMGCTMEVDRSEYPGIVKDLSPRWEAAIWALAILAESRWFVTSQYAN